MEYVTNSELSIDGEFILSEKVLPTAKEWVMSYPPGNALHENGHKILRRWGVKCPELRRRMQDLRDSEARRGASQSI